MSRRKFPLTASLEQELRDLRDHADRPYRRERAAALLKVAAGESRNVVARTGLLRPRQQRTVSGWLDRYEQDGVAGLVAKPRGHRGFSP